MQVINQYSTDDGVRSNRYDVTVLVNGLPLVHIELKRRGVALKEAFNQINRYQRESFWSGSGLFEYVQIFVISNGTHTKYYSNTTRKKHLEELNSQKITNKKRTSCSFEFTSWWADANNKPIPDLIDFAKTFFAKRTLLNILTKYCVFTTERLLLVMRPYQIAATERILQKIEISNNYKKYGTIEAGGFVWHTTGSGKTLTSFKTAQLASKLPYIDKVLFVVDRKDLDYQTMREYDRFEKGAANSNTSTAILKRQLEDPNVKIIITTIQKLDRFIKSNKGHEIYNGHVVVIFDECHRSQFGDMHLAIVKAFKNYHLFGFTGTPIFAINASSSSKPNLKTTVQVFGCALHGDPKNCPKIPHSMALHTYTIVDAIGDQNVLPFKVDYISTFHEKENIKDQEVKDIDREKVLMADERISKIVKYVIDNFDKKTKRNIYYTKDDKRLAGFNSIFATANIEMAKKYYAEFKKQLSLLPDEQKLKIALIYSYGVNDDDQSNDTSNGIDDENSSDTNGLDKPARDFLEAAIQDYNKMFGTSYDTSSEKFENYYKDVSERMKTRQLDMLIVVNMFLTGFDATTLNTLWVDKNLQMHGLLQAYSRTNRILNSVKTHGNIICFRNLEQETNEALALFGDKNATGIVLIREYKDYYYGYHDGNKYVAGYKDLVEELLSKFPVDKMLTTDTEKYEFVKLFGSVLKAHNILTTFDKFEGNQILSDRVFQDYKSKYLDIYHELKPKIEKEVINNDLVFELELIKQVEINIDYILDLIKKYHEQNIENKEILININTVIGSSLSLRNKKDLIFEFVEKLSKASNIYQDWKDFAEKKKYELLDEIIKEENLKREETYKFIENAFHIGSVPSYGTELANILPPISRFTPDNQRVKKQNQVWEKLNEYFNKFYTIVKAEFGKNDDINK